MNIKQLTVIIGAITFLGVQSASAKTNPMKVDLSTDKAKLGYTIGAQIMNDLIRNGVVGDLDVDALIAAQKDVVNQAEMQLTTEQMQAAQEGYMLKKKKEFTELGETNKKAGEDFVAKNKSDKSIKTTASGLMYQIQREGKGSKPTATNTVKVHYIGSLIDGTPFDSSYKRNEPAEFPVAGVIPGFSEGLQMMKEGAKYRFIIPSDLAYGVQGPPAIGPNQTLVFEVELIEVKNAEK